MPIDVSFEPIEAVLFDVDGTLVDSIGGLVKGLGDTFERYGNPIPPDEIRKLIGIPLVQQMRLAIGSEATPEQIQGGIDYTISRYAHHHAHASEFEDAVEALRLLQGAGIKIALVTSKNATEIEAFWPKFSASHLVDAVVCASDVIRPKPDPESAVLACKKLGVAAERAVMVGDSIYDIQCARGAGVAAIAVAYGSTDAGALMGEEPDALFQTPTALLEWVRQAIFNEHGHQQKTIAERAS